MRCSICKMPVQPRDAYQRVTGWEKPGHTTAGGSSIVLRERVQEWACAECITRLRYPPPQARIVFAR